MNLTNVATDYPRAARASLWDGDLEGVKAALSALDAGSVHGRVVDLERRALRAGLSAHDGDRDGAAREYAEVLPELAEMGLAYKQALVVLDMALVLGPTTLSSRPQSAMRGRSSSASARERFRRGSTS